MMEWSAVWLMLHLEWCLWPVIYVHGCPCHGVTAALIYDASAGCFRCKQESIKYCAVWQNGHVCRRSHKRLVLNRTLTWTGTDFPQQAKLRSVQKSLWWKVYSHTSFFVGKRNTDLSLCWNINKHRSVWGQHIQFSSHIHQIAVAMETEVLRNKCKMVPITRWTGEQQGE